MILMKNAYLCKGLGIAYDINKNVYVYAYVRGVGPESTFRVP